MKVSAHESAKLCFEVDCIAVSLFGDMIGREEKIQNTNLWNGKIQKTTLILRQLSSCLTRLLWLAGFFKAAVRLWAFFTTPASGDGAARHQFPGKNGRQQGHFSGRICGLFCKSYEFLERPLRCSRKQSSTRWLFLTFKVFLEITQEVGVCWINRVSNPPCYFKVLFHLPTFNFWRPGDEAGWIKHNCGVQGEYTESCGGQTQTSCGLSKQRGWKPNWNLYSSSLSSRFCSQLSLKDDFLLLLLHMTSSNKTSPEWQSLSFPENLRNTSHKGAGNGKWVNKDRT